MSNIRVILVDDHPIVLAGIKALLQSAPEVVLVGEATNGIEAIAAIRETKPDIAVVDISIPKMTGLAVLQRILQEQPELKVLILTLHDDRANVQQALAIGAQGYLTKRSAADELIRAIRAIAAGGIYLDPVITGKALSPITTRGVSRRVALSDREIEVLTLVTRGFSSKQIGECLAISVKTVETYKARAVEKLGLHTRAEIVIYGAGEGWLDNL